MPPIIYIPETSSTNTYLKEMICNQEVEEGTIIATHHQLAGRGQKGSSWEAEKGKNLTFSLLLKPDFVPIMEQFIISQMVSLAIHDVLSQYTSDVAIKWPNDIYWREKKICGILIENILGEEKIDNCIVGIGLNVNQEEFLSSAPNPISLKQITNQDYDLETMLTFIQLKMLRCYKALSDGRGEEIVKGYKSYLYRKDGYHLYADGEQNIEARIADIQSTGYLVLETLEGEIRTFAFKEVKYVM